MFCKDAYKLFCEIWNTDLALISEKKNTGTMAPRADPLRRIKRDL